MVFNQLSNIFRDSDENDRCIYGVCVVIKALNYMSCKLSGRVVLKLVKLVDNNDWDGIGPALL